MVEVWRNMNSTLAVVVGFFCGGALTCAAMWISVYLRRPKRNAADEAAKNLLRGFLERPKWQWASIVTLANVVGTDEAGARRLLLEMGARASMRDGTVWGLVSRNPIVTAPSDPVLAAYRESPNEDSN